MTECVRIGRHTLYLGDALEVLPTLAAGSVDAVVTDPPYSSGGAFRSDRVIATGEKYVLTGTLKQSHDFAGDNRDQRSWTAWSMTWLAMAMDATATGGMLAMFSDWRQLPSATDALQGGGWVWRGIIPWDKTEAARPARGWFRAQCEYIITATRGSLGKEQDREFGECLAGIWTQPVIGAEKVHQTEKPVGLLAWLISPVRASGTVLDPFLGSGTTAVACEQTGRACIGVEKHRPYFDIAVKRLEAAVNAAPLFDPPAPVQAALFPDP